MEIQCRSMKFLKIKTNQWRNTKIIKKSKISAGNIELSKSNKCMKIMKNQKNNRNPCDNQ